MNTLLLCVLSYLIGAIPFALIVGKWFYKVDVRTLGSGNLGSTNVFRNLGKKAGISVLLCDVLKGTGAASLPFFFHTTDNPLLIGLFAIIGHSFTVFAKFKGGKSVATTIGVFLFCMPYGFLCALAVFLLALKWSKYVSLSSILSIFTLFVYAVVSVNVYAIIISFIIFLFITLRHKQNLIRIKQKTEPKVTWI